MANHIKVWVDAEADYLEVTFSESVGHMQATDHDAVMERVDAQGNIIGFRVMGFSPFRKGNPLNAELIV